MGSLPHGQQRVARTHEMGVTAVRDYEYHLYEEFRAGRITRRDLVRRASVVGISLSVFGGLLGATTKRAPAATAIRRGGTPRIGIIGPAADVDPVTMYNAGARMTAQPAGEYLCFPRPDYSLDPRLAVKWEAGPTPKTWTFTIRPNVRWHDGSALTVDDVVATFDRLTDPATKSAALSNFKGVLAHGQVEKVGEGQVRFHLDRPFADFPYLVSSFNYNTIILPKNYQIGDFEKGGIGTGPFILKRYTPKVGATYIRNPNYWAPDLPYLDGVNLKYYAEDPPIVLAMQAGDLDIYAQMPFRGAEAIFKDTRFVILRDQSSAYHPVHLRVDKEPFTDKRARQALALALDRPGILKVLFSGNAHIGNDHAFAPVFPVSPSSNTVPQRQQDYARARSLLAAAGVQPGVKIVVTAEEYLEIPQFGVVIKEQAKPAGFDVQLNIVTESYYYGSGSNQPWLEVPIGITDWSPRGVASQLIEPAYTCHAIWNSAHWCNAEFDRLMNDLDAELDLQKRRAIAAQAARIQQDETPALIAFWLDEFRATTKAVHGLAPGPNSHLDLGRVWMSS
jgi:peptide/nickel transport system substrate-binding protein